jgi:adenylate cyclase, class 2
MVEVEQKFRVEDTSPLRATLERWNARACGKVTQRDAYYNHPARDFGVTDEALRLRTVDGNTVITYKGPKQPGEVKTRREIELPLTRVEEWDDLLESLGFRQTAVVVKQRESWQLLHDTAQVVICFDQVERLGQFVEIEVVADPADVAEAQQTILDLAQVLGLVAVEPRSYLEMVLAGLTA